MPTATADVYVDASPAECFEFLRVPANHVGVVPGLRDIDADPLDDDGYEGEFTYVVAGVPLTLGFRDVQLDPPERRVFEVTGPMEGTATYEFVPDGDGTRFTLENDYELPGPDVLDAVATPVLKRYIQSDAESWVANAKAAIESA